MHACVSGGTAQVQGDLPNNLPPPPHPQKHIHTYSPPTHAHAPPAGHLRRRGSGLAGKAGGARVRLEDMQAQFGVGLREAAARLGICTTTLKRACRRHGIQRWPRRALQKVNRALDDMEQRGGRAAGRRGGDAMAGAEAAGGATHDSRLAQLAGFIPAFQQQGEGGGARGAAAAMRIPAAKVRALSPI
jgi:hypothetical protein